MSQEGILMRKVQGVAGEERKLILLPQLFHRKVILNAHDKGIKNTSEHAQTAKRVKAAKLADPFY